jgi:2-polyprenyl-3-methyl-5-hydroxy-6-metoxy-1,4-benzoquinol methylase
MKNTTCPYCKVAAKLLFSVKDINQKMTDENFNYFRCKKCGLIFLNPIPNNIQDYYGQSYAAYQKPDEIEKKSTDYEIGKLDAVKKYAQGNTLLEVGPGNGNFAYLIKKEGFIVDTIEMDLKCSKFLEEEIKIRNSINSSNIKESIKKLKCSYDVIAMWHVLEHLEEPWNVLKELPRIMTKKAIVVIAVPNPESLQFKIFKKYWKHVDAPRHLLFFPSKLLVKEMERIGFHNLLVTTNDKSNSYFNTYGWWQHTLNNYIAENPNRLITKMLRVSSIEKVIYNSVIRILEQSDGSGNAYLAVFQKNGTS